MKKLLNISLAALISIASESCVNNKYCTSIDLENRRRLETCIVYDNGKPSGSTYTIFNGWNLPVNSVYDYGLDGPDKTIEYEYDRHRNIKSKTLRNNREK